MLALDDFVRSATPVAGGLAPPRWPDSPALPWTLGFLPLEALAGQLGDRPEPLPMFLELGHLA